MALGRTMDQVMVGLVTAILVGIGGLIYAETASHATEEQLAHEVERSKSVDVELKAAQAELTRVVTKHIRVDEARGARVDEVLKKLEKYLDKNGG